MVCEYNPFHNGHAYQLGRTRELTGCAYLVCVMSGAFTQRGIPAVLDARTRARMALVNGADVVFELPALFAVRDARAFARGSVALLDALNVCGWLSFGCEDTGLLDEACALDESDPAAVESLRDGLARGETFARARGLPNMPNLILGVEYRRALAGLDSAMEPVAIPRVTEAVMSASKLRSMLPDVRAIEPYVPRDVSEAIIADPGALRRAANLDSYIIGILRMMTAGTLADIVDVGEGLENRILAAASVVSTREELIARVKCKRYTYARLSRILAQAAIGLTKPLAAERPTPGYARLLGFRETARPLLRLISDNARIPIVYRAGPFRRDPVFQLDIRAEAAASLAAASPDRRRGDGALTSGMVKL